VDIDDLIDCIHIAHPSRTTHRLSIRAVRSRIPAECQVRRIPWVRGVGRLGTVLVPRTAPLSGRPPSSNLRRVRAKGSPMNNVENTQGNPPAMPSAPKKDRTRRCYQCNGSFGLVRHRIGLKQFCSIRCLDQYKADIERTATRIKEWAHFLSRKL
jgi:hypothetical protein